MEIEYTNWGLANYYEDKIKINRGLKKYPKLHNYVLTHEQGHQQGLDLMHELPLNMKMVWSLFLFCLIHPRTWIDLSPVWYSEGRIEYDPNKAILYLVGGFLSLILLIILKIVF